jgi:hypothetical protein
MLCDFIFACKRCHTDGNSSPVGGGVWSTGGIMAAGALFLIMAEQMLMKNSDLDAQACPVPMIMCVVQMPLSSEGADALSRLRLLIARYFAG